MQQERDDATRARAFESAELVRRSKTGDRAALDLLFTRYYDDVHRAVRLLMGREVRRRRDSGDIVHEAFLKAIELIDDFEVRSDGHFRAWLVTLAMNRVRSHIGYDRAGMRDVRREHAAGDEGGPLDALAASSPSPSDEYQAQELLARLAEVLDALPEDQRRAWVLRRVVYGPESNWEEIGAELGRGATAARKLYERARDAVTTRLARHLRPPADD